MAKLFVQVSNCFVLRPASYGRASATRGRSTTAERLSPPGPAGWAALSAGGKNHKTPEGKAVTHDEGRVSQSPVKCDARPLASPRAKGWRGSVTVRGEGKEQERPHCSLSPPLSLPLFPSPPLSPFPSLFFFYLHLTPPDSFDVNVALQDAFNNNLTQSITKKREKLFSCVIAVVASSYTY